MIELLLPPGAVGADTCTERSPGDVSASEAEALGPALPRRRREFATGRGCARRALAALGVRPAPLLRGPHGEPLWPAGVVGSITHCTGYCAAAATHASSCAAIGIDAEVHDVLPAGVLDRIARREEAVWVRARDGDGTRWDRLLFSAKESIFKAWFALTGTALGFADASVTFAPGAGTFAARLVAAGDGMGAVPTHALGGRFAVRDGLAITAIALPGGLRDRIAGAPHGVRPGHVPPRTP